MSDLKSVRRALLSVTDKTGLVEFAGSLNKQGVELVSTGGTAKALRDAGLPVRDVSELTGFPEMLGGRVKTLHPMVHGGILHRREDPEHVAAVAEHEIPAIDMVVVNLYAFEKTANKPGVKFEEIIENIDIGGPSMLRSAAKNFEDVAVVTSVADYPAIAEEMRANGGALTHKTRWRLARAAFATTAAYDAGIASTLESLLEEPGSVERSAEFPETLRLSAERKTVLRYGENPHQAAAVYVDGSGKGIAGAEQLGGKELSYNNLVDLDACWALASEFDSTAVAIIKHTNPCGVGQGTTVLEAYQRALEADPVSAFGGVIGINRTVDAEAAAEIAKLFVEAIVAPEFTPEALAALSAKKNLRLLRIKPAKPERVLKQISGGYLLQDEDFGRYDGRDTEDRDGAQADEGRDRGVAVCVEGVQAREVERDFVRASEGRLRTDGRGGRRTDEPRGCGAVWGDEGGVAAGGYRRGVGCVLPLSGWRGSDCQGGRDSDYSAGRVGSRRRSGRGGESVGYRYGNDGVATLQARIGRCGPRNWAITESEFLRRMSKD